MEERYKAVKTGDRDIKTKTCKNDRKNITYNRSKRNRTSKYAQKISKKVLNSPK